MHLSPDINGGSQSGVATGLLSLHCLSLMHLSPEFVVRISADRCLCCPFPAAARKCSGKSIAFPIPTILPQIMLSRNPDNIINIKIGPGIPHEAALHNRGS
jgi:hypothetical protein